MPASRPHRRGLASLPVDHHYASSTGGMMGGSNWGYRYQGARAAALSRVEDAEKVLRRAIGVFCATASDERVKRRKALQKKAERVLHARLHFLKVKLAAAQYAGPQDDRESHARETERLRQAEQALLEGGPSALLVEFGAGHVTETDPAGD